MIDHHRRTSDGFSTAGEAKMAAASAPNNRQELVRFRQGGRRGRSMSIAVVTAVVAILSVPNQSALAIECPVAEAQANQHVLRETQKSIEELSSLLSTGDVGNRIGEITMELRRKYPAVTDAELVNYFVTAYCPVVDSMKGLSDDEKRSRLDEFSSEVFQAVDRAN